MATLTRQFQPSATGTRTLTITVDDASSQPGDSSPASSLHRPPSETLVLKLKRRKKKVSWKEGTVDNEFLNRKSSKKCCIFHKEKPFDEDYSDDEEENKGCCNDHHHNQDHVKIAVPQ
ncbi:unnamed protein product [Cuscuta epithymum]|uniref:Protein phosphatase 1 regulatory subunit 11 n=1 Tax=Cuscuta epithymum TaxID=186058 RepID=A0AAV0FB08_9ASTE|nr:unnamed protein product [Cuscuta epithymum]CAH9132723.1 unnamed protein product [Cuscuta epithymum]